MNRFLANKEFTKYIRHNKKLYKLNSVFDDSFTNLQFDKTILKYKRKHHIHGFDKAIQQLNLTDDLDNLYDTGIFD